MRRISDVLNEAVRRALRGAGGTATGRVNRSVAVNLGSHNAHRIAVSRQDTSTEPTAKDAAEKEREVD